MEPIIKQLLSVGLSEKEGQLYAKALELGPATLATLAKQSNVKRPTAYNITELLIGKELMTKVPYGKRTLYRAEPPKRLREQLNQRQAILEILLPQLERKSSASFKQPKITFHESKEGIKTAYYSLFNSPKTIYSLFSPDDFYNMFTVRENKKYLDMLKRNGGYLFDIFLYSKRAAKLRSQSFRQGVCRAKILPKSYKSPVDILATDEKTVLISYKSQSAIVITDDAIAMAIRMLLQSLWKQAT
jgi:predicted transcriptional regulator